MLIQLKCCYTLLGSMNLSKQSEDKYTFTVPSQFGKDVIIEVSPKEKCIDSYGEKDITDNLREALLTDVHEGRLLSSELQSELSGLTTHIADATRDVLSTLKYCLNHYEIKENLLAVRDEYWLANEADWKRLPALYDSSMDVITIYPIDSKTATLVQNNINKGIEPFVALRHLQRARTETIPRYKWIDAAIAAELAIKQYLLIKDPSRFEERFKTSQSPSIDELYDKYLKEYSDKKEASPVLEQLKNGAKIRNDLLHYRRRVNIDPQDAINYVLDVERAIYHLLTLLYPNDLFIRKHYATILVAGASRNANNVNISIVAGQSAHLKASVTRPRKDSRH